MPNLIEAIRKPGGIRSGLTAWLRPFSSALDLLYPPSCVGCGTAGGVWCPACDRNLQRLRPPLCDRCGGEAHGALPCRACELRPLPLLARSYARYADPLVKALLALKYRPNKALADRMACWLETCVLDAGWVGDNVVPVPLSAARQKHRGYNQAELLAASLARRLQLPLKSRCVQRIRDTRSQVGLIPAERWRNVQGAFQAVGSELAGGTALLVDDLFTTGATLSACALALHSAGARKVFGLTVARA